MTSRMKTALQQAIDQMNQSRMNAGTVEEAASISFCVYICEQHLTTEREQIEWAYNAGDHNDRWIDDTTEKEYYEKTYNESTSETN